MGWQTRDMKCKQKHNDKELWGLADKGYDEPTNGSVQTEAQGKKLDELKLKDMKVENLLFQTIERTIMEIILVKDTFQIIHIYKLLVEILKL